MSDPPPEKSDAETAKAWIAEVAETEQEELTTWTNNMDERGKEKRRSQQQHKRPETSGCDPTVRQTTQSATKAHVSREFMIQAAPTAGVTTVMTRSTCTSCLTESDGNKLTDRNRD